MRLIIMILCFNCICNINGNVQLKEISTRIVGGIEAARIIPYQVGLKILQNDGQTGWCGGSLISHKFILTAAHCCDKAASIELILGTLDLQKRGITQRRIISRNFIIHHGWNASTVANDIALIKSPVIIFFNKHIKPIKLPPRSLQKELLYGKRVLVSGWGKSMDNCLNVNPRLQYITVPIILNSICERSYQGYITDCHICTSGVKYQSTCNGDSGGPCAIANSLNEMILIGVTSFGTATCESQEPSVYTWILPYLDWIKNVTKLMV